MKFALGCAFNLKDIFMNFPLNKLKVTSKECINIIGDKHRRILAMRVFKECVKLAINDIIDNNITFVLPLVGNKKCYIYMKRIEGETFKDLKRKGKWKNLDFITSMFSGYQLVMEMHANRTPRTKSVYLNPVLRDKIVENVNNGKTYC